MRCFTKKIAIRQKINCRIAIRVPTYSLNFLYKKLVINSLKQKYSKLFFLYICFLYFSTYIRWLNMSYIKFFYLNNCCMVHFLLTKFIYFVFVHIAASRYWYAPTHSNFIHIAQQVQYIPVTGTVVRTLISESLLIHRSPIT